MANTERFEAIIELNSQVAQSRLKDLEAEQKRLLEQQKKLYQENTAESKKQANAMQKDINRVTRDLKEETRHVKGLNAAMQTLSSKTYKDLRQEVNALNRMMRDGTVKKGSEEWRALAERIKSAKREMREYEMATQDVQKKGFLSRMITTLNTNWGAIVQIGSALTGLTMTVRRTVQDFADMEEAMADTRKYTGLSDAAIRDLNEDLKKMDTRTPRQELNELAGAAGRLGKTSKEDILDFVEAGNMIKVALGDDLGDGAIDKVGKLAMAFGEDENMGLRGAMLATGSAVNELAQNSSAQAGYLVDFTARVAGFGKQLGLTQAQIMGFGAVMDENLLRDEMAATAFGNMLTKMQTDTEKFARIAGMDIEKFAELLKTDANGAILALADSLKKADPQSMMKMLDDMGLDGSRAVGVLATLADKIDDVRDRQELANKAYKEGVSIQKEYDTMNNTVQADIDKARKRFQELSVELGEKLLPIVKYTITTASATVKLLSVLTTFVINHTRTIAMLGVTIAALTVYRQKDIIWTKLQVFWNEKLIAGMKALRLAMAKNPWTVAILAATTLVGIIMDVIKRTDESTKKLQDQTAAMREQQAVAKAMKEVNDEANQSTMEEVTKLNLLRKTLEDNTKKYDERKKALDEIKSMVPEYHGTLTQENTLINNNSAALDQYVTNLKDAARAQAAFNKMVKLASEYQEHEETLEKREGNKAWAQQQLKKAGATTGTTFRKNKHWGYSMYDEEGKLIRKISTEEKRRIESHQRLVAYNDKRIAEEKTILSINEKQSEKLSEIAGKGNGKTNTPTPTKYVSDADRKKQQTEAQKAEAERLKQLREADKEEKGIMDERLAENMLRYRAGIIGYREYVAQQQRIQEDGLRARMAVWGEEDAEYKKYQKQLAALQLNGDEQTARLRADETERNHVLLLQQLEKDFEREGSAIYHNEIAYNEARFQEEMAYLEDRKELTRQGSLERMRIEWEIDDLEKQHQLESERQYQDMLQQVKTQYLQQSDKQREEIELTNLDELYKKGLLKEEEYQRARRAIQAQYSSQQMPNDIVQQDGANMLANASNEARKGASMSDSTPIYGTISMYMATMEKLKELYGQDEQNHAAYLAAKQQATSQFCQQLASEFQTAYQSIGNLMSSASSYYGAQSDYEVAMTKKKYEKQIEAAGKNQKKVKKLQEQQAKEEAAIKTKYNQKQVRIQIAQAIAQTATNALNAYGSAAAIPVVGHVLAPIAAAMAVAAGMLQVATIKKQAAAQEAGYYEGGFTHGKRYRREAGVVHEGEFVANHQAVNNPNVMPMLQLLDRAQRNNTVGSLSSEDISRAIGGGNSTVVTPIVNVSNDNPELLDALERVNENQDRLATQLEQGIGVDIPIAGEDGMYNRMRRYQNLLKSK